MAKSKIITSFSRYSDSELSSKAAFIISSLTGNTSFPSPTPPLAELQTALQAFNAADEAALDGEKLNTAIKNQKRSELVALLVSLALYVQLTSNNDEVLLLSSGFDLKKSPAPIGVLPKPDGFKVQPGDSGTIKLSVKKINGAKMYLFQYTTAPAGAASAWGDVISSRTNTVITGLRSGTEYAFRAAGMGSDPSLTYSDVISSFVL